MYGRLFEFDNEDPLEVKMVSEFGDKLDDVNLIVDRGRRLRIGINAYGNAKVYEGNRVIEESSKIVWGYVNSEKDSVLLFVDNTMASYSNGFTRDIDKKFKMLKNVKYRSDKCEKLTELRIINEYFIASRVHGDDHFYSFMWRTTNSNAFSWDGDGVYHWSATDNPFVVYELYYGDSEAYKVIFATNGHFTWKKEKVNIKPFPLPKGSFKSVGNFFSDSKILMAVDLAGNTFEFRLYDTQNFESFRIVSKKISKK